MEHNGAVAVALYADSLTSFSPFAAKAITDTTANSATMVSNNGSWTGGTWTDPYDMASQGYGNVVVKARSNPISQPPTPTPSYALTAKPNRLVYTVGDTFDTTGLKVTETQGSAQRELAPGEYSVSSPDMSATGTKTVTVMVNAKNPTPTPTPAATYGFATKPSKPTYRVGDKFNPAGLRVTVTTNGKPLRSTRASARFPFPA